MSIIQNFDHWIQESEYILLSTENKMELSSTCI